MLVNLAFVTTLYPALLCLHYRGEGSEGPSLWERGALRARAWWAQRKGGSPRPDAALEDTASGAQGGGTDGGTEAACPSPPAGSGTVSGTRTATGVSEHKSPVTSTPATPGDGSAALEFADLDAAKYRFVEQAFGDAWGPWLVRHRVLVLAVSLVPVLALAGVATQLEPMQQQTRFFPPDWFAVNSEH